MALSTGDLVIKDPDASAWPKGIDWTDYLANIDAAETVATSAWVVTGSDSALTTASGSIVNGSKKTQIKFSAGTLGVRYTVTNSIVTSSGVHDDRSFYVLIQNE
jgi:hypothetical protein